MGVRDWGLEIEFLEFVGFVEFIEFVGFIKTETLGDKWR
jgi:hypothetical protein